MPELVTLGETMAAFMGSRGLPLRYEQSFGMRSAGAESNVAVGAAKLGHSSGWISRLGEDEFGEFILRELRGEGVDVSRVLRSGDRSTGVMFKEARPGGETKVFYYRRGSAASALGPEDLDEAYIAGAKILHVSGITPALSPSCAAALSRAVDIARAAGVLVSFDPNLRLKLWSVQEARRTLAPYFALADIVLLGLDEAAALLGTRDESAALTALLDRGVAHIGLKLGARGAIVAEGQVSTVSAPASPASPRSLEVPAVPVEAVDPIGAGDAFDAGFLCGLLEGKSLEERGAMGVLMGALATTGPGDFEGLVGRAEFDRRLAKQAGIAR